MSGIQKHLNRKGLFTVSQLLEKLKARGYFGTQRQLQKYEKKGIIPEPKRRNINGWEWRVYTKSDIEKIIEILDSLPTKTMIHNVL